MWIPSKNPPAEVPLASFAASNRVQEAWVSVGWPGPDAATRRVVSALRGKGITGHALGGDPGWVEDPTLAVAWAKRVAEPGLFSGIHLDIEPWTLPDWKQRADRLLVGLAQAVRRGARATPHRFNVDLAPWLAETHPGGFDAVAGAAQAITLMSYRSSSAGILAYSAVARSRLARVRRPYRLAVETLPTMDSGVGFAGGTRSVMNREISRAEFSLAADSWFKGFAVHDLSGWRALR